MVGSHDLGWYLPWKRSIFTWTNPVCCLYVCRVTHVWNTRVISFYSGLLTAPEWRPENPSLLLLSYYLLTAIYPTPTNIKEVCVYHYFLSNPRDFPTLLSPASLIYHQCITCNPLTPPLLIVMYKIGFKFAILWNIFSICQDFPSWQFSSVWLK